MDNVAENFQLQPDNGIFIKSWFDDMSDTALEELSPLLKEIVEKKVTDVRGRPCNSSVNPPRLTRKN